MPLSREMMQLYITYPNVTRKGEIHAFNGGTLIRFCLVGSPNGFFMSECILSFIHREVIFRI